jgi:hypothetical protein
MLRFLSIGFVLSGWMILVLTQFGYGQSIIIDGVQLKDTKVIIYYQIQDSLVNRSYSVRIYSIADGFMNPLQAVTGDVGLEVKSGLHRKIVLDTQAEWPNGMEATQSFEIRARVFIPFINTESINQYKLFKRNRKYNLTWTGGSAQNVLNFDLYKGERKVTSFPNVGNSGHHLFVLPSHVKPGSGYRFRISDARNKDEVVYTQTFRVKRKIPLGLKAIPLVVAGYLLYEFSQAASPADEDLPTAPDHPVK